VNELFGLSMTTIMVVLLVLLAICLAVFGGIFFANRIMFRMGLRNLGRRRAQTSLVVAGLMLATVIITASFATGDTLDHSITKLAYQMLNRTDLRLKLGGSDANTSNGQLGLTTVYAGEAVVGTLEQQFAGDPDIAGFMPIVFEPVPIINPRTRLAEPTVQLAGIDTHRLGALGGLTLSNGKRADLAALGEREGLLSERTAGRLDARQGDVVTVYAGGVPWEITVKGIVRDELAGGVTSATGTEPGGFALPIATVQEMTGHQGHVNFVSVALRGDERSSLARSAAAAARLDAYLASAEGKAALGLGDLHVSVQELKQESVDAAEEIGNSFTAIFMVLGLFSIAAGVMLIFMLFVMLAAERRTEMGIARAVGAGRGHLVQMFVAEGVVYDLIAGAVGAFFGCVAGYLLVATAAALMGDDFPALTFHVSLRSLVVCYSLGAVLTFITVAVSSARISRLNIVAAIQGQSGPRRSERGGLRIRWPWLVVGVPALILPPLGLWLLLRKGVGLPWPAIVGPGGTLLGVLLMVLGTSTDLAFPFTLGVSLIPLSVASLAVYCGAPRRLGWSLAGGMLALYWLAPSGPQDRLFGKMSGSMEMFVLSGIMIVTGFTLVIVFNARLLTTLFASRGEGRVPYRTPATLTLIAVAAGAGGVAVGDTANGLGQILFVVAAVVAIFAVSSAAAVRFPRFAPALKMGVAYPLASRFRTGMTVAMFSLVVFSITVMGIINESFIQLFAGDDARAGWDVHATSNPNNPVVDLPATLGEEGSFDPGLIVASGRTTPLDDSQEVRQPGRGDWETYFVRAADDDFFAASQLTLDSRAFEYASDGDVLQAVRSDSRLAIIDALPLQPASWGGNPFGFYVEVVKVKDDTFQPFDLEIRDPVTGRSTTVSVVGVLSGRIPFDLLLGLYINEAAYAPVFGPPSYEAHFLRLAPGTDAKRAAKDIKAALVTRGVQAKSIEEQIDETMAQQRGIMRLIQAFMGLGLFVGIASLGVIALRSVVERRQQIGMLRAIGYQKGTVALSFLLESGFISLMGILSGVVGAAVLSWNLLNSEEFSDTTDITYLIPWVDLVVYCGLAFVFAMLLTWWPSHRASSVPIADALRYE
jgi:putative ABC transport system permease protein